jgi:CelD/BcsL family acetyltransferase involved in cellulose biosynthesis
MMSSPMAERALPDPAPLVAAAPTALRVDTVSDFDSFLDLEPAWNRLLDEAVIDNPFLRHEWVRTWWECFGDGRQLHVLTVRAGSELVAIAPLMLSRERVYGLTVRRLQTIANVHTQRADLIVGRGAEDAHRAIWDGLVNQKALWDVVVLCQVPGGSATLRRLPALAAEDGFPVVLAATTDSPCISLAGRWEDYFNGLARKHRSNLRNRLKRLEQIGRVTLEVIQDGPQVGPALEEGLRIEAAAWKGRARSAILSRPELRRFYTQFAAWAAQRGWLQLQFLNVGGRRIAFGYSLCYKRRLYLLKPGYDPAYARYSPSNILLYLALRDAFASGILAYDLLGANDPWKREWTEEATPHTWLFVFGETPRARALHFAKAHLVPWLKRVYRACRGLTPTLSSRVPER